MGFYCVSFVFFLLPPVTYLTTVTDLHLNMYDVLSDCLVNFNSGLTVFHNTVADLSNDPDFHQRYSVVYGKQCLLGITNT